jgi:3-ketoacyl-CoA synthase
MNLKPYVPDFTTAFEHFCIHPGGKAVIDEVSKQLKLRPEQSLPMLVPFERYGNTSSSSTWSVTRFHALFPQQCSNDQNMLCWMLTSACAMDLMPHGA